MTEEGWLEESITNEDGNRCWIDYDHWISREYWTDIEAFHLLTNRILPPTPKVLGDSSLESIDVRKSVLNAERQVELQRTSKDREAQEQLRLAMRAAIDNSDLRCLRDKGKRYVRSREVVQWAVDRRFDVPEPLKACIQHSDPDENARAESFRAFLQERKWQYLKAEADRTRTVPPPSPDELEISEEDASQGRFLSEAECAEWLEKKWWTPGEAACLVRGYPPRQTVQYVNLDSEEGLRSQVQTLPFATIPYDLALKTTAAAEASYLGASKDSNGKWRVSPDVFLEWYKRVIPEEPPLGRRFSVSLEMAMRTNCLDLDNNILRWRRKEYELPERANNLKIALGLLLEASEEGRDGVSLREMKEAIGNTHTTIKAQDIFKTWPAWREVIEHPPNNLRLWRLRPTKSIS